MPYERQEIIEDENKVEGHVRAWEFTGEDTLHRFWAVERLTEYSWRKTKKGAFNFQCEDKELSVAAVGTSGGGCQSSTFIVVVPIITNAADAENGDELYTLHSRRR